jgi:hypothetical protein
MLDVMYLELVEDTRAGVTAVVQHISTRIEQALFHPLRTPLVPYKLALRCCSNPGRTWLAITACFLSQSLYVLLRVDSCI